MISFKTNFVHLHVLGISAMNGPPILQTQAFMTFYRLLVSFVFLIFLIPIIWFMALQADSFKVYLEIITVIGILTLALISF